MSRARVAALASTLAVLAAGGEMFLMVGPFAAYFYAVYGPALAAVQSSAALAWLAEFYCFHIAGPVWFHDAARRLGLGMIGLGLSVFGLHAAHLYWMKFALGAVAQGLLYRWVRHPQYLGLLVAGFGLAIRWPRFASLVAWLAMAGAYFALALFEEASMRALHGEVYSDYASRTAMFLPGAPGRRLADRIFGPRSPEALRRGGGFALAGAAVLGAGFGSRALCLRYVSTLPFPPDVVLVSPQELDANWLEVARLAAQEPLQQGVEAVFFASDFGTFSHLLMDAGVPKREQPMPRGRLYVLRARAIRPCLGRDCPPVARLEDALSPFVLRRPVAAFYAPLASPGTRLERIAWDAETVPRHASVPVL